MARKRKETSKKADAFDSAFGGGLSTQQAAEVKKTIAERNKAAAARTAAKPKFDIKKSRG